MQGRNAWRVIVSEHLCGVAVAYDEHRTPKRKLLDGDKPKGRAQGSLINFQKRKIADAVEWMRTHSVYKPRIFVCTTSPDWNDLYTPNISAFVHNLRNGYGCKNFVWVREFTKSGLPHYHFVADMDKISSPVGLSLYWSSLFGGHSKNSVRLGSKPDSKGKRTYWINSPKMAWYMSCYYGKDLNKRIFENCVGAMSMKVPGRTFGISQEASKYSLPSRYEVNYYFQEQHGQILNAKGEMVNKPSICIGSQMRSEDGLVFNKSEYTWKKVKDHNVYFGKKKWQPATTISSRTSKTARKGVKPLSKKSSLCVRPCMPLKSIFLPMRLSC